jgi:hypothetical protein
VTYGVDEVALAIHKRGVVCRNSPMLFGDRKL